MTLADFFEYLFYSVFYGFLSFEKDIGIKLSLGGYFHMYILQIQ